MPAYTTDSGDGGSGRQIIATLGIVVVALTIYFLPSSIQQQIGAVLRETVLRPFVTVQRGIGVARTRATDSEGIRQQFDSLVAVTVGHRTIAEENRRLRGLLELKERLGPSWVAATVIRPGTAGSESMFLLDLGSESGLAPHTPVITSQGLLGRIEEVYRGSAMGMDWTHPDFRASAMDPDGMSYGMVENWRGDFREADRLQFNGAAFHSRLEDGTVIVTSGLGVFPRGIPIGKIEGLAEADEGWRKSYWLRPMVEVGSPTHVLVGVGPDAVNALSGAWPIEDALSEAELAMWAQAREDSLRAMGDSVMLLRTILTASTPVRDSVLAALLLGDAIEGSAEWLRGRTEPPQTTTPAAGPRQPAAGAAPRTAPAQEQRPAAPAPAAGAGAGAEPQPSPTPTPADPVQQPGPPPPTGQAPRPLPSLPAFPPPRDTVQLQPRPDTLQMSRLGGPGGRGRLGSARRGLGDAGTGALARAVVGRGEDGWKGGVASR